MKKKLFSAWSNPCSIPACLILWLAANSACDVFRSTKSQQNIKLFGENGKFSNPKYLLLNLCPGDICQQTKQALFCPNSKCNNVGLGWDYN